MVHSPIDQVNYMVLIQLLGARKLTEGPNCTESSSGNGWVGVGEVGGVF